MKTEKDAYVLHRIDSGENRAPTIECRQGNQQKIDSC